MAQYFMCIIIAKLPGLCMLYGSNLSTQNGTEEHHEMSNCYSVLEW